MKKLLLVGITMFVSSLVLLVSDAQGQLPPCVPGGACLYGGSVTTINSSTQRVEGYAISYLNYQAGQLWHPFVEGWLFRTDIGTTLDYRYARGTSSYVAAEIFLLTNDYIAGRTYCTYSRHYLVSRENPNYYVYGGDWEDCKTIPVPTPTPTPFPTPTPCDSLVESCQTPTPTPTPTPSPSPEIQSVGFTGDFPIKKFITGADSDPPILDPTWQKGASDNAQNYVAYEKGTESTLLRLNASIQLTPAPPSGTMSARVRMKYSGNIMAAQTASTPITGNTINVVGLALSCPGGTPNPCRLEPTPKVKKATYDFAWEVSFDDGQTWTSAGTSQHVIFWTYGPVAVEPPNCRNDGIRRNCLFVNRSGYDDWPGLYDKALDKGIAELDAADQTPDQIAKRLAFKIDDQIVYNANSGTGDVLHPLAAYAVPNGVQCSVNANLLRGLLRSIGINNSETVYVWGGKPNNTDKLENETGGSTYWFKIQNASSSTGVVTGPYYYTFQAIRPASNEGPAPLQQDPFFNFHAMVKVYDDPAPGPSPTPDINLAARYYDPSYAKRLQANPSRYSDYPYINNDLKFRLAANLDDPNPRNHRFEADGNTKPFVVRALTNNLCIPFGSPPPCADPNTKVKTGIRNNWIAAIPRTSVFDPQGFATFSVWRPSDGVWYTHNSYVNSFTYGYWGMNGDKPIPADYDGDGYTDYAVFRPSDSTVYILASDTQTMRVFVWNSSTDKSVYGDFDGDGKSDIAFYRPETRQWYINRSSDGVTYSTFLGNSSGVPVSGDFDGDGKTDPAIYKQDRWGTWLWMDANGNVGGTESGGGSTDIPVPGDYDGDGKTDFAVYNPSSHYWQILYSNFQSSQFYMGVAGDVPVPGDYDGDGKTDAAVWSPSNGHWLVIASSDGTTIEDYWGGQAFGDIPVGSVYIYP